MSGGAVVSSWSMAGSHTHRTLERWQSGRRAARRLARGMGGTCLVPEYPWNSPPIVVNGRTVQPYALIEAEWLGGPYWMGERRPHFLIAGP
jgi:hypothetical protein